MVDKFYDVKKENFLNDLTDFIYAFAVKYKMFNVSKKIVENVDRYKLVHYPRVTLNQDNWKLITDYNWLKDNFDNKYYFVIWKQSYSKEW
ncbi:spiroplasma plectrovirus-related protein [Spiroplasma phoeniceum P40]|uniref:Spiroplasma plectrovirus-related protein n=1 Tax=Spiroplasma phoeniceum P40 TaxID=1276259 RepID=A0A345DRZ2_9MOLU|nr:spiroplasma plectrovirus-related protein [Spiroplasma phoeniceum P40]